MKNLTDDELFALANEYLADNSKHGISSMVLAIAGIIQSLLFLFGIVNFTTFAIVIPIVYGISYYHLRKGKQSLDKVDDILKEFDSRINNQK